MKPSVYVLAAIAVMATTYAPFVMAQNTEPLMKGSSSVTPGDETPLPAVDRLSDDVSPAAHANTTATDQAGDAGTIALPPAPEVKAAEQESDPAKR